MAISPSDQLDADEYAAALAAVYALLERELERTVPPPSAWRRAARLDATAGFRGRPGQRAGWRR